MIYVALTMKAYKKCFPNLSRENLENKWEDDLKETRKDIYLQPTMRMRI